MLYLGAVSLGQTSFSDLRQILTIGKIIFLLFLALILSLTLYFAPLLSLHMCSNLIML